MIRSLAFAAFTFVLAAPAFASDWNIDVDHSDIGFTVRHMMVSNVHGDFTKYTATITMDDKDVTKSAVAFDIDASSINTKSDKRDTHLKSAEFFDVAKFPKITFKSTKIDKGADNKHLKVTGDLTIHGVTKPTTFQVSLLGSGPGMGGSTVTGWEATAKIKRSDFGVNGPAMMGTMLGEDVALSIGIEAGHKK
jgi:polyisoprenoid-binding protein YceI